MYRYLMSPGRWSIAAFALVVLPVCTAAADGLKATAEVKGCASPAITGTATLLEQTTPEGIKEVTVELKVTGLADGKHAVHIHEAGTCEPCAAAGGHHDPGPFGQPRPDSATKDVPAGDINHPYHMGDLINLEVRNGVGYLKHTTNRITLSPGRLGIFDDNGSSLIVHASADTYCNAESDLKQGCAGGAREACGILEPAR